MANTLNNPENKGIYRPLKNDGAPFKCSECKEYKLFSELWFVITPRGDRYVCCKNTCIDDYWIKHHAIFDPTPI
jgi:hypothetical protein